MRQFNECTWLEAAETVLAMVSRLTVMKSTAEDEPMRELVRCMESLITGDIRAASDAAFDMTAALVNGDSRRVSGDLFRDYLLHRLLIVPNSFSRMAAANSLDEALYSAMRTDMGILYELMGLDSGTLYRCIQDRFKELKVKSRPGLDETTRLASAAWGGGTVRPKPEEPGFSPLPAVLPDAAPVWEYGEEGMRGAYVADEALEEMYHRLLEGGLDWSSMTEDVWNFFAAYGTGDFLRYRHFILKDGALVPLAELRTPIEPQLWQNEYKVCLDHCIEFMRGNSAEPLLLLAGRGMGKTSMLFSLADDLPEMRLVYVPSCGSMAELTELFALLSRQPLKFMVALDECACRDIAARAVPANVLLMACGEDTAEPNGAFTKAVRIFRPQLDGFVGMVQLILDHEEVVIPRDAVRAACVDCQVDTKGELTAANAVSVARALIAGTEE